MMNTRAFEGAGDSSTPVSALLPSLKLESPFQTPDAREKRLGNSRWTLFLVAVLVMAAGLFPMLDALGVFAGSESRMNAPRWVVLVAASLFFIAGMYVLLLSVVGEAMARGFGMVVGMATFLGLAAIVNWIAFGGGDRNDCSGGVSALGIGFSSSVPEIECRAGFGYGALLMDFIFLRGTAWWIAQRVPENRAVRVLEKVSEWAMGLLLLPLIALVVALTAAKTGAEKLARKLRSSPDRRE